MNALLLTGDSNTASFTKWKVEKDASYYEQIRDAVGGSIELVYQNAGMECYGNENGMIEYLPQNESVAYFLEEFKEGLGCRLYWGPFVVLFTGKAKKQNLVKAQEWFEKYKSGKLFESDEEEEKEEEEEEEEEEENEKKE